MASKKKNILSEKDSLDLVLLISNLIVLPGERLDVTLSGRDSLVVEEIISKSKNQEIVFGIFSRFSSKEVKDRNDLERYATIINVINFKKEKDLLHLKIVGQSRVKINSINLSKESISTANVSFCDIDYTINHESRKYIDYVYNLITTTQIIKLTEKQKYQLYIEKLGEDARIFISNLFSYSNLESEYKLKLLESNTLIELILSFCSILRQIQEFKALDKEIEVELNNRMNENQKKYYIREKIKVLYDEINEENPENEINELEEIINSRNLDFNLKNKLLKEVSKLRKMNEYSAEASVIRNYIDTVLELPWEKTISDNIDINRAQEVLNKEHFGLKEIKDTVLEYLSVLQFNKNNGKKLGTILCLIGPPGVGKTSLGESIANALNRKFERIALGGVSDESEIRGHRRTYIGSMPGRIIEALRRARVNNPVILLDEIDKLSNSYKGDPASALLEVLDPAQNKRFKDNYIDIEFDLSDAFFICTANDYSGIPAPLLDRMEVIEVASYTIQEKLSIAKNYLVKQAKEETNITNIKLSDTVILEIINKYTREAGVRNLKREIVKIFRKSAKILLTEPDKKIKISLKNLSEFLGIERYKNDKKAKTLSKLGVVKGLAWTAVGGTTLNVEAVKMEGKGIIQFTGKLGDVMKESSQVAYTYVRANRKKLGIEDEKFYLESDIHLHFPEGATPKDGPSAGITITTAIISALSNRKVRQDIAMTGEITITGEILPVGGIKEKILGANRIGISEIILPEDNKADTKELSEDILSQIQIYYVKNYSDVVDIIFTD